MSNQPSSETDPCHHTVRIKEMLDSVMEHVREDIARVNEPKAQDLLETTAAVLQSLVTAYDYYDAHHFERVWK